MVVQLHAFLAWAQCGGKTSSFAPRSPRHLRKSCCVPNEVGGWWREGSGACLATLGDRKIFDPDKNRPPNSTLTKPIDLNQVPLSVIADTRHLCENTYLLHGAAASVV